MDKGMDGFSGMEDWRIRYKYYPLTFEQMFALLYTLQHEPREQRIIQEAYERKRRSRG